MESMINIGGKVVEEQVLKMQEEKEQIGSVKCEKHDIELDMRYAEPRCEKRDEEEKAQRNIRSANFNYNRSLPERLKRCTFDTYIPKNQKAALVLKSCKEWVNNKNSGLIMLGSVGTGKTHLAVAIGYEYSKYGIAAKFCTLSQMMREVKSTWGNKLRDDYGAIISEQSIIEAYSNCGLLIVDEIGSQYGSENEKIIISEIINNRYNNMLPTIVIGNITISEAEELLGSRVIDRLKENGKILVFDWNSYRGLSK